MNFRRLEPGLLEQRSSPSVSILLAGERHADVLRETVAKLPHLRGNILHDAHSAVLIREHGIEGVVTLNADFLRPPPFVSVIHPLTD